MADCPHATTFDNSQEGRQAGIKNGYMGIIFAFVLRPPLEPPSCGCCWGPGVRQIWGPVQAFPFTSPGTLKSPPLSVPQSPHQYYGVIAAT